MSPRYVCISSYYKNMGKKGIIIYFISILFFILCLYILFHLLLNYIYFLNIDLQYCTYNNIIDNTFRPYTIYYSTDPPPQLPPPAGPGV